MRFLFALPFLIALSTTNFFNSEKKQIKEFSFVSSPPINAKIVILKLDDFGSNNTFNPSSTAALDYIITKNKKASIGVIASKLSEDVSVYKKYINAKNDLGQNIFEIWNHGLTHDRSGTVSEFRGNTYSHQKAHFETADSIIFNRLGVRMHSFGSPFNQNDSTTTKVISENQNYKVCMFANPLPSSTLNLNNKVNLEVGTGNVIYESFVKDFEAKKTKMDYMVLQGHPILWDADELNDFKKCVDYLIEQGCVFMTPYEYYIYKSKQ